jgi:hypothetical protein
MYLHVSVSVYCHRLPNNSQACTSASRAATMSFLPFAEPVVVETPQHGASESSTPTPPPEPAVYVQYSSSGNVNATFNITNPSATATTAAAGGALTQFFNTPMSSPTASIGSDTPHHDVTNVPHQIVSNLVGGGIVNGMAMDSFMMHQQAQHAAYQQYHAAAMAQAQPQQQYAAAAVVTSSTPTPSAPSITVASSSSSLSYGDATTATIVGLSTDGVSIGAPITPIAYEPTAPLPPSALATPVASSSTPTPIVDDGVDGVPSPVVSPTSSFIVSNGAESSSVGPLPIQATNTPAPQLESTPFDVSSMPPSASVDPKLAYIDPKSDPKLNGSAMDPKLDPKWSYGNGNGNGVANGSGYVDPKLDPRYNNAGNLPSAVPVAASGTSFVASVPSPSSSLLGNGAPATVGDSLRSGVLQSYREDPNQIQGITTPRWQPDHEAKFCGLCAQPFSILRRRHHCRQCGQCRCDRCSQHAKALPSIGYVKPVRVCDSCMGKKSFNNNGSMRGPSPSHAAAGAVLPHAQPYVGASSNNAQASFNSAPAAGSASPNGAAAIGGGSFRASSPPPSAPPAPDADAPRGPPGTVPPVRPQPYVSAPMNNGAASPATPQPRGMQIQMGPGGIVRSSCVICQSYY